MSDTTAFQRDIAERRARLARTLGELKYETKPATIVGRERAKVKARFTAATQTPEGQVRVEVIAAAAITAVAVIGVVVWRRRH